MAAAGEGKGREEEDSAQMGEKGTTEDYNDIMSFLLSLTYRHTSYVPYPWQPPIITVLYPTENLLSTSPSTPLPHAP